MKILKKGCGCGCLIIIVAIVVIVVGFILGISDAAEEGQSFLDSLLQMLHLSGGEEAIEAAGEAAEAAAAAGA